RKSGAMGCAARAGVGLASSAARQIGSAASRRPADRDLPAWRALLHGCLSIRGEARAPDARHAAYATLGTLGRAATRLRRHRLFAGGLGRGRHGADDPARKALA